jgi:heme-degrading monooxygenase HmoA
MVVALFLTRLRADADTAAYGALGERMVELVQQSPGFDSMEFYSSDDGAELMIARFESREALDAWRANPEHLEAQRAGRERFFAQYRIEICDLVRTHGREETG